MTPAIRVDNLSKLYRIGARQNGYKTLRETVADFCTRPIRRIRQSLAPKVDSDAVNDGNGRRLSGENFWALKDVSFEVQPGEVVGIIGRNGAGKSTLLKILSRITEPTQGRIELRGRVGSLLEVGTGFHPELSGRENVYMNGSMLGMSRREIGRKFDEIIAFAEIDDFLETPVKRYSSGMFVRLAFAVAAHLEPEILIVDEVLAVGDATFQRRCLDRMAHVANSGATVLLVSHNLEVMPNLCQHALLLEQGRVQVTGEVHQVINQYISSQLDAIGDDLTVMKHRGNGRARFTKMQLLNSNRVPAHTHISGEDLIVRMEIESSAHISGVALAVIIQSMRGMRIITSWTQEADFPVTLRRGIQSIDCRFHQVRLRPGHQFTISLWMAAHDVIDVVDNVQTVQVIASTSDRHFSTSADQGIILCNHTWSEVEGRRDCVR